MELDQSSHGQLKRGINRAVTLFLWNKRDLWEQADSEDLMKFTEFKEETIKDWRRANFANELGESMHSNELPDDVAQVVERLIAITDSAGSQL